MIIKKTKKITTILFFLFMGLFWVILAIDNVNEWFKINNLSSAAINAHNICRSVYNWGSAIFVPTRTTGERESFRWHKPSDISLSWCPCKISGGTSICDQEEGWFCSWYVAAAWSSCWWYASNSILLDTYMLNTWNIRNLYIKVDNTLHKYSWPPTVQFNISHDNQRQYPNSNTLAWLDWNNTSNNRTNSSCDSYLTDLCKHLTRYNGSIVYAKNTTTTFPTNPSLSYVYSTSNCWQDRYAYAWSNWVAFRSLLCTYDPWAICPSYSYSSCPTSLGCIKTEPTSEIMWTCVFDSR